MKKLIWALPALIAGCVEQEVDVSAEAGAALFQENCAACHGTDARGAGELGRDLFVVPPDLTTLAAQNGGVFPRDYVMGFIDGYHAEGADAGPRAMPEFGETDMGPTIIVEQNGIGTPVPARLLALVTWLETVQE